MIRLLILLICAFSLSGEPVEQIKALPSGKVLFETVEADGPLTISYVNWPSDPFAALWDSDSRTIYINTARGSSEGQFISSIVFELHNAKTTEQLEHLYDLATQNLISKDEFVESVEWMEYQNLLESSELLLAGIKRGALPKSSYLPVLKDFHSHYQVQQLLKHSDWLANRYEMVNLLSNGQPYYGTIDCEGLSKNDRHDLAFYIVMRDNILHDTPFKKHYLEMLQREYAKENQEELLRRIFDKALQENPEAFQINNDA